MQLRLAEFPRRCCTVVLPACDNPITHVLVPGPSAHCDEHEVRWYARRDDAWGEAFEQGRARILEVG